MTIDVAAREPAPRPQLGSSRARVLDALQAVGEPVGVHALAASVGLHVNTTRFHLDALVESGMAERAEEDRHQAGRPRVLYRATPDSAVAGQRSYRLLAEILTGHIAAHSRRPGEVAENAGREWGRYLAQRPAPFARIDTPEATRQLLAAMSEIGFAPELVRSRRGSHLRLTHCPFREIASEHQQVVCSVHFGLMQGLLGELDAPIEAHRIEPFAEPSVCLVHLRRTRAVTRRPNRSDHVDLPVIAQTSSSSAAPIDADPRSVGASPRGSFGK